LRLRESVPGVVDSGLTSETRERTALVNEPETIWLGPNDTGLGEWKIAEAGAGITGV
jgi:hypothetical protein